MAEIRCTIQEYHRFIGPFIRNRVNAITRSIKKEREGICESCNDVRVLESAHVHGKGRRRIIEKVLQEFTIDDGTIIGDLSQIESKIIDEHIPIEKTFRFLCSDCHREYDRDNPFASKKRSFVHRGVNVIGNGEFRKIGRIKLWAKREHQTNHKFIKAYLELSRTGNVTWDRLKYKCAREHGLNEVNLDGHFNSLKTDGGNAHGKVFYEDKGYVYIYPVVMEEIKKYFKTEK